MATIDDALTPPTDTPAETPAVRRSRSWPRVLLGFVIGLVLTLALTAGGLAAWDSSYEGRVLPGVNVGGVDVAGMDRAQATAALKAAFAHYGLGRVVIHTDAGDVSVLYGQFGRRADVDGMVDAALREGRSGTTVERALGEVHLALAGTTIEPALILDEAALGTAIAEALSWLEREPVDAGILKGSRGVSVIASRDGRTYDAAAVTAAALGQVRSTGAPDEVRVDAATIVLPPARTDADVLAAKAVADRMVGEVVVTFGDRKWTFRKSRVRTWITLDTAADGSVRPTVDVEAIAGSLGKIAKRVYKDPLSAVYLRGRGGKIVGVAAGKDGRKLDELATAAAIAESLAVRGRGLAAPAVPVQTAKVPPKLTTAEALKKGAPLMSRLGSWKTWFPISERNYFGANIWLPAKIIDGTVLYPGERFEWWSAVGPVTPARGFGPGGFIAGDHTEPTGALGGGMCSSSTTLFNAALRAGLQMGARSNHKYYITRYPLGLDATVSKTAHGSQTLSFVNDTKNPIVIRSFRYVAGGLGWVRYEIWGIPDGRTVSLTRPAVTNLRKATTSTVYVDTLPKGQREQVEYPSDGMDVVVTRVVRNGNGRVIHVDTYRSHYTLWNGRIEVGR